MHIAALLLGVMGVALARGGAYEALLEKSLPEVGVPAISLPGLATSAQLREQLEPTGVSLKTRDDVVLTAPAIPETTRDTELRALEEAPSAELSAQRARVDVTPEPAAESAEVEAPLPPEQDAPLRAPEEVTPEDESQTNSAAGQGGVYFNYVVASGDTVASIAGQFGLLPETILAANPTTIGALALQTGQNLRVPYVDGVLVPVQPGDTVSALAARYGTSAEAIINYAPNGISSPDDIRIGAEILVVGGVMSFAEPEEPPPPPEAENPFGAPPLAPVPDDGGGAENPFAPVAPPPPPPVETPVETPTGNPFDGGAPDGGGGTPAFVWPFGGNISSYFGPNHPLGIDIDGFGKEGSPVAAAASGVVTFAGGDPGYSYGYYVIISHSGGFETLYAHLSSIAVSVGQSVGAGEAIGIVGTTGYSTGTHLHFEVRQGGAHLNPMVFLP